MKKKKLTPEKTSSLATYGTVGAWGIWDLREGIWLGTPEGPLTYSDAEITGPKGSVKKSGKELAEMARAIFGKRLNYPWTRLVTKIYDGTGTQHKDDVDTVMTGAEAIKQIEEGKL
jgi:hypothetical protein